MNASALLQGLSGGGLEVNLALLSLGVDLLGGANEGLVDILRGLGTRLQEVQAVLLRELLAFIARHLTAVLHVGLVAHQDDHNVVVAKLAAVLQPSRQVLKGLAARSHSSVTAINFDSNCLYTYRVMSYTNKAPAAPR